MRILSSILTFAALLAAFAAPSARGADVLYVGDGADNTVKRFDADTGAPLDDADDPFVTGLLGPRTLLVADDRLLVVNQNVFLQVPGEVLAYDLAGTSLGALVSAADRQDAPYVPWGMIRGGGDDLYVSSLSTANGKSHGEVLQYDAFDGTLLGVAESKEIQNKDFHPRSLVFGPDGLLYVSFRSLKKDGLGGAVLRFAPDGSSEVFIRDDGGFGRLNRPDGLAFDASGNLYVMSFRAGPGDADAIRIYDADGDDLTQINLFDPATQPRVFAQAMLFGPEGKLHVPISNTGEVRAYYGTGTGDYDVLVPATVDGGQLLNPLFLTFGKTNPTTLNYEP
jgi:hypothetical protein